MIKLPGYNVIILNAVYAKPVTSYEDYIPCNFLPIKDASELVILSRFKTPILDGLVGIVTSASRKIISPEEFKLDEDEVPAANILAQMDSKLVSLLSTEDKPTIAHLRVHYPSRYFLEGRDYVNANIGLMPDSMIVKMERMIQIRRMDDEERIKFFIRNLKNMNVEWYLRLRLEDGMRLPEVESLLEMGVSDSSVLDTSGNYGTFQNIASHTRLLCKALDTPKKIGLILDDQDTMRHSLTMHMLVNLGKCSNSRQYMQRQMENATECTEEDQMIVGEAEKQQKPAVEEPKEKVYTKEELFRQLGIK